MSEPACEHCDGTGQVHHGEGALHYVTLCPNQCALRAWDLECEALEQEDVT